MKKLIIWLLLLVMSFTANAQLIGGGPRKPKGGGGVGTVTSVGLSVPTGLTVSGSPVTEAGTLALSLSTGYSIPTTANQANWTTAYGWGNHASAGYASLAGSNTFSSPQSFTANWSDYQASFGQSGQGGRIVLLRGNDGNTGLMIGASAAGATQMDIRAANVLNITSVGSGVILSTTAANGTINISATSPTAGLIDFQTGANKRLRINTDGTIIVDKSGTMTSAGYDFDVLGTARVTGGLTLNDATITKGTGGSFIFPAALSVSGSVVASGSFNLFGGGTTESSAVITVNSTSKGFLPPRMTSSQRTAISSPATGLIVYQTDGTEGVYVNTSTGWKQLAFVP